MHHRPALLCLFVTCGFLAGPLRGQGAPSSEDLYAQAYDEFLKRDYTTASRLLDQINPEDQKKTDILNLRGAIYKRLGELDNAANAFNDALKINPKDWVPKFNLAEINFLRGEYPTARNFLQEALAAMPEADRTQKQDLVLYKVYLTRLLEGDMDKAKLMLDGFDMNSPNPIYYFGQAAWHFKNKEDDKARILIESTEGLYSEELRNAYGQALVDIGWMEPLSGVKKATTLAAAPAPTASPSASTPAIIAPPPAATPEKVVATATTPAPTVEALTTPSSESHRVGNQTPAPSASPAATKPPKAIAAAAAVTPAATPANTAVQPAATGAPVEPARKNGSGTRIILLALLILGSAGIALLFLGRRSRFDTDPDGALDHHPRDLDAPRPSPLAESTEEGTGDVRLQSEPVVPLGEPVKVRPIGLVQREEPGKNDPVLIKAPEDPVAARKAGTATAGKKGRAGKTTPLAASTRKKSPAAAAAEVALAGTRAKAATKAITSRSKDSGAKAAPAPAKTASLKGTTPIAAKVDPIKLTAAKKTVVINPPKPAETPAPAASVAAPAPEPKTAAAKPAKAASRSKPAPAPKTKGPAKTAPTPASTAPASTPEPAPVSPTIPAPIPAPASLAADIPPATTAPAPAAAAAAAAATPAPKPAARPSAKGKRPVAPLIPPTVRPTTPLITIPEFEEGFTDAEENTPVLRIVPTKIPDPVNVVPPPAGDLPDRL